MNPLSLVTILIVLFSAGLAHSDQDSRSYVASALSGIEEPSDFSDFREIGLRYRFRQLRDFATAGLIKCGQTNRAKLFQGETALVPLMKIYSDTMGLKNKGLCRQEIEDSFAKLSAKEKRFFNPIQNYIARKTWFYLGTAANEAFTALWAQLDPTCVISDAVSYKTKKKGSNPCFAGAHLLNESFIPHHSFQKIDLLKEVAILLIALKQGLEPINGKPTNLDLWKFFWPDADPILKRSASSKEAFLAALSFMTAVAPTVVGFVDIMPDIYVRKQLEAGIPPEEALQNYHTLMRLRDAAGTLLDLHAKAGTQLFIYNQSLKNWNRHNFMSAFLTCHFKNSGYDLDAITLTELLGIAYEAKDFLSHIGSNRMSIQSSIQNFKTDTARYRASSTWAFGFCNY